jgi:Zn-dependent protease
MGDFLESLRLLIIMYPALIVSITFHECAHAWTASFLGDDTARLQGRVTLNPLPHLDPIGTVLMPMLMFLTNVPCLIGWAKPVPVNPYNLREPKRDYLWISLAGPMANFGLVIVCTILFFLIKFAFPGGFLAGLKKMLLLFLSVATGINLLLGVFNLIPVPPLDGSGILSGLLPPYYAEQYNRIKPYGFFIILFLLLTGLIGTIFHIVIGIVSSLPLLRTVLTPSGIF